MKIFKQITSIVMAVAMAATIIAVNPVDASAKVTIKSGKKIALTVGKKTTIKVYPRRRIKRKRPVRNRLHQR